MSDFPWGGLIGGVVGGAVSLYNNQQNIKFQEEANKQNIAFQQSVNDKNEKLMRESWARDDSAVQRRTQDLVKAGLNPILAAGSAAGNSGPIQLRAPQVEAPQRKENEVLQGLVAANAAQDFALKRESVAQTQAQTRLINAQAEKTTAEKANLDVDVTYKNQTLVLRVAQATSEAINVWNESEFGTKTLESRINTQAMIEKINIAKAAIADNERLTAMQTTIQSVIESKIKAQELTQKEGLAMQAVAVGTLAKMQADFYSGMGMSKDLVMILSSILGDALKGALILAR